MKKCDLFLTYPSLCKLSLNCLISLLTNLNLCDDTNVLFLVKMEIFFNMSIPYSIKIFFRYHKKLVKIKLHIILLCYLEPGCSGFSIFKKIFRSIF